MMRQFLMVVCVLLAAIAGWVGAVEPDYVRTTTYDVNGIVDASDENDVVTTVYSDGLGRQIQTKLKLAPDESETPPIERDRVTCFFFDDAGRPAFVTKPFVDDESPNTYLAGELHSSAIEGQLEDQYPVADFPNNEHLYTETEYWDDPLSQVKTVLGPGRTVDFGFPRSWTLGVSIDEVLGGVGEYTIEDIGIVTFENGIINKFDFPDGIDSENGRDIVSLMDAVYEGFLTTNPFTEPTHFLTVARTPDEKISQELKDVFGRTVVTFSSPDIQDDADLKEGMKITAKYRYDILGNVLEEIPPKDEDGTTEILDETKYTYNTLGQLIKKESPDGGFEEYDYNDDGSIRSMEVDDGNFNVRRISYFYDAMGRSTRVYEHNRSVPGAIGRNVINKYYDDLEFIEKRSVFAGIDADHLGRVENVKGRLSGQVYSNYFGEQQTDVGEVFSYDDEGRLRFKITTIDGMPGIQETWYEYDIHGKVTVDFCFYGGKIIKKRYTYDKLGRLYEVYHSVTEDGGYNYDDRLIAAYGYDDLGTMRAKTFNKITDGYQVGYGFDLRNRLNLIAIPTGKKGFAQTIPTYNLGGNIAQSVYKYFETTSGSSDDYSMLYQYDDVNRLKKVFQSDLSNEVCSYEYDPIGRFTSKEEDVGDPITGYNYYDNTNRLKKTSKNATGEEYVYDSFGNLIVDFTKKMVTEYDWRNMPVAYRFYTELPSDITADTRGTCDVTGGVYNHMNEKVEDESNAINLVSTVFMYYDASGNRVGKIEVKEP